MGINAEMMIYAWIIAYSVGLVTVISAVYYWIALRKREEGFFVLFLIFFLLQTVIVSFEILYPSLMEPFSPVLLFRYGIALGIGVSLPLYTSARTRTFWLGRITIGIFIISLCFLVLFIIAFILMKLRWLFTAERLLRWFLSAVIIVSILPFLKKAPRNVGEIPPKFYQLAGVISVVFSAIMVLPLILEEWGVHLRLNEALLYLALYSALNLRFLFIFLPKLIRKVSGRDTLRQASFESYGLSPREREVYDLLSKGYTYKEIARLLGITLSTVKTHIDRIYKKTGTGNRIELMNEIEG